MTLLSFESDFSHSAGAQTSLTFIFGCSCQSVVRMTSLSEGKTRKVGQIFRDSGTLKLSNDSISSLYLLCCIRISFLYSWFNSVTFVFPKSAQHGFIYFFQMCLSDCEDKVEIYIIRVGQITFYCLEIVYYCPLQVA